MKELLALGKEKKERMHNYNQRFAAHLNNFNATIKPAENTLIEYYTSALGPDLAMFVKRLVNPTLVKMYEEAKKVEAKMESIDKYATQSEEKKFGNKKPLLLTKPKDERSHELDGVVKMVQKLSNRVIDMEKEKDAHKQHKPYYKKRDDSGPSKPPSHSPSAMNLPKVGMENFCTFHQ